MIYHEEAVFAAELSKMLEDFRATYENQDLLERQINAGEVQIGKLQNSLSELQACLTQEREHCLMLSIENEILREELVKISNHFKHPVSVQGIKNHLPFTSADFNPDEYVRWKHVHHQLKCAQEQAATAIEESQVVKAEAKSREQRTAAKINSLLDRLKNSQQMLYETTKNYYELKKSLLEQNSASSSSQAERPLFTSAKRVARNETKSKEPSSSRQFNHQNEKEEQIVGKIESLQKQIEEIKKQTTCNKKPGLQEIQSEQMELKNSLKHLKDIRPLYQKLERKHNFEIEGLKADMKEIKSNVGTLEGLLSKTVRQFSDDEKDIKYLEAICAASLKMKAISDEMRRIKLRLAQLENSLKTC